MQNDFVPVVTAGRNVTVERTERGYRVSSSASPATVTLYTGYLAVRAESPTGDGKSAAVRVVDGSLPAEQQLNYLAGMVEVDHIFHPEASDSGTAVQPELRRYRVEVNPRARLHLDEGESVIYLSVHVTLGAAEDGRNEFDDPVWEKIHITAKCKAAPEMPEPEECEFFLLLATAKVSGGVITIHQQNAGEPHGLILSACEHEDSDSEGSDSSDSGSGSDSSRSDSDSRLISDSLWSLSSSSGSGSGSSSSGSSSSGSSDSGSSSSSSSSVSEDKLWYGVTKCLFDGEDWRYMGTGGEQKPIRTGVYTSEAGLTWEVQIRTVGCATQPEAISLAEKWAREHPDTRCNYINH